MTNIVQMPVSGSPAPNDSDLERMLLASIIADNSVLDKIGGLQPEMLFDPTHAAIMAAALDLRKDDRPVNLVTLKPRFGAIPFAGGGTVFDYLKRFEFAGNLPKISDVADSLMELHLRRDMQALGERLAGSVWDQGTGPGILLSDVSRDIDGLLARSRPAGVTQWNMTDGVDDFMDSMLADKSDKIIPTGFSDLDKLTGGWRRGEYTLLAGRPSMGKSALAVCLARRAAKAGHGVAVFSLEMSKDHWIARTVADMAWTANDPVSFSDALKGSLNDHHLRRFGDAAKILKSLPLVIEEQAGLTVAQIAAKTRQIAQSMSRNGTRLGLVLVDHIGKVKPTPRYKGNRVLETGETSAGLFNLAKSENIAMLALSQLNRGVEGRDNKRPGLADLRDSGDLEQDADMVLFPYRASYYLERMKEDDSDKEATRQEELEKVGNVLELQIAKQRNGPTATVELYAEMSANAIRSKWVGTR